MRSKSQFTRKDSTSPPTPSPQAERGQGGEVTQWRTPPQLWEKLKPLAREMRQASTPEENILWQKLRNRSLLGFKFRRQHAIDRFIVDLYCAEARLVVEIDGPIHQYSPGEDKLRQEYLESLGFWILRFSNNEIRNTLQDVLDRISVELFLLKNVFSP